MYAYGCTRSICPAVLLLLLDQIFSLLSVIWSEKYTNFGQILLIVFCQKSKCLRHQRIGSTIKPESWKLSIDLHHSQFMFLLLLFRQMKMDHTLKWPDHRDWRPQPITKPTVNSNWNYVGAFRPWKHHWLAASWMQNKVDYTLNYKFNEKFFNLNFIILTNSTGYR